ncbi:MAG: FG-GAP repeat protein [Phycisphaerales bacterium]|nr:FG-GAP repeat protein [Phycisphaerales bacterium]
MHVRGNYLAVHGDVLIVGVPTFDGMSGRADFHQRDPLTGAWKRASTLIASDGSAGDQFGYGVCVLGGRALLGAHRADGQGTDSGTVYEFDLSGCVCPADFDGSGFVDLEDFVAFVLRFEAGC